MKKILVLVLIFLSTSLLALDYDESVLMDLKDSKHFKFTYKYIKQTKIDKVLIKDTFLIGYSYKYKQPIYTISKVTPDNVLLKNKRKRYCEFKEDESIPKEYRSTLGDYRKSGFDRGHIASYASSDFTKQGAKDSCLLSNISPQIGQKFNRSIWRLIEEESREIAKKHSIYIITVVFFDNNPWNDRFLSNGNKLKEPDGFFKFLVNVKDKKILKYWMLKHKEYSEYSEYLVPKSIKSYK